MSEEDINAASIIVRRERRIFIKLNNPAYQQHDQQNQEFLQQTNAPPIFEAGDEISGVAFLEVKGGKPVARVRLALICLSQVRLHTYGRRKSVIQAMFAAGEDSLAKDHEIYFDRKQILQVDLKGPDIKWPNVGKYELPFRVSLPIDGLPSTMKSCHGFIKYTLEVFAIDEDQSESRGEKEIVVVAPIHEKLDLHGRSLEKSLHILGSGKITITGSLERKEFLPGEVIPVEVTIVNDTNIPVQPLVSLYQTQVFSCNQVHRTLETCLTSEPYTTIAVEPNYAASQIIKVPLTTNLVVSLRSPLIAVKYFVHVSADIPHSMDLNINLPFLVTTQRGRAASQAIQAHYRNGAHVESSAAQLHSAACIQQHHPSPSPGRSRTKEFSKINQF